MVLLLVLVVVLQVFIIIELLSLVRAVEAVAEDQVVVSTVVELLMVAIKVVTQEQLHRDLLPQLQF